MAAWWFVLRSIVLTLLFNLKVIGAEDPCRNEDAVLIGLHFTAFCASVAAGILDGVNCDTLGAFCGVSCGLCHHQEEPHCDEWEIYNNKARLLVFLHDLGFCHDCEALPVTVSEMAYVYKAGDGISASAPTAGYSTLDPKDPCLLPGVTCDRCGAARDILMGQPYIVPITGYLSNAVFKLHRLQVLIVSSSVTAIHPDAPWIPGNAWSKLRNLTMLFSSGTQRGEFPILYNSENIMNVKIQIAELSGDINNMLGSPQIRLMVLEDSILALPTTPFEWHPRTCDMELVQVFTLPAGTLRGEIPSCLSRLRALQYIGIRLQDLYGPVERVISSPVLELLGLYDLPGISGTLPSRLSESTKLRSLVVTGCSLQGLVPDLSRLSDLALLDLSGNQLTGTAGGTLSGPDMTIQLSGNRLRAFPLGWLTLPRVRSLDLASNSLSWWPAAGMYGRGNFSILQTGSFSGSLLASCNGPPATPALDWPSMRVVSLANNPMSGMDVRDVLGSLAGAPKIQSVDVTNCSLAGDLPSEGGLLLPQLQLSQGSSESAGTSGSKTCLVRQGFPSLVTLKASANLITGLHAGPWRRLQQVDFSENNLSSVHPSWFSSAVTTQRYGGNPAFHLAIEPPGTTCGANLQLGSALMADSEGFSSALSPYPDRSECTSLCISTRLVEVDPHVNASAMCRCRDGWYGSGTDCRRAEADSWSTAGSSRPQACPPHSSTLGLDSQVSESACKCDAGFYASVVAVDGNVEQQQPSLACLQCPANRVRSAPGALSMEECEMCEAGREAASGQRLCTLCGLGSAAAGGPGAGCRECEPGLYARAEGLTSCQPCPLGSYQNETGASGCVRCPTVGSTTLQRTAENTYELMEGAPSIEHCGCEPGRRPFRGSCEVCGVGEHEGLICPGGISNAAVRLAFGYYSDSIDLVFTEEISVFHCWGDEKRCPGQRQPGDSCAQGRRGLTCALCEDGKVPVGGGMCKSCTLSTQLVFPAVVILAVFATIVLYVVMECETRKTVTTKGFTLLTASILSLIVAATQQIGVISQMADQWFDPLETLIDIVSLMTFDVEVLKVGCFSMMKPMRVFLMRLLAIFGGVVLVCLIHVIAVVGWFQSDFSRQRATLVSSIGSVATIFFIAVVTTITGPLQCEANPNQRWTCRSYQSVECWQSPTHFTMMLFSMLSLVLVLTYVAGVCWVVHEHPKRVSAADTTFLKSYRFLILRFKPETFWYAAALTISGLLLSLTPVSPNQFAGNFLVQVVLLGTFLLCATFTPWRIGLANHIDLALTMTIIVSVNLGIHEEQSKRDAQRVLSWLYTSGGVVMVLVVPAVLMIRSIWTTFYGTKRFRFFLCHYKAQAGAFARLLKTLLGEGRRPQYAFLDCDDLEDLNSLFTHVSKDTQTLLVLNSGGVLFRPWCAGEVATAHSSAVEILPVRMPDYKQLTQEDLQDYHINVDVGVLTEAGITMPFLRAALAWYEELPGLQFSETLSKNLLGALVDRIVNVNTTRLLNTLSVTSKDMLLKVTKSVILVDHSLQEVVSAAFVLENYLAAAFLKDNTMSSWRPWTVECGMMIIPEETQMAICMFSEGCWDEENFVCLIGNAADRFLSAEPVLAHDTFRVPSKSELEAVQAKFDALTSPSLVPYVVTLLKIIAKFFNGPYGSETSLRMVTKVIAERLRRHIADIAASANSSAATDTVTLEDPVSERSGFSRQTTPMDTRTLQLSSPDNTLRLSTKGTSGQSTTHSSTRGVPNPCDEASAASRWLEAVASVRSEDSASDDQLPAELALPDTFGPYSLLHV